MTHYVLAAANWLDFSGVVDWFRSINDGIERRARIRSTINELNKLTDRELNDIGIARGDIWSIAHDDTDYARNVKAEENTNLKGWV